MLNGEQTAETRVRRFVRRIAICLVAALLLDGIVFLTIDHIRYPDFLLRILFVPSQIYCYYLSATEPLPTDDIPLFEAGRAIDCYFTGLILNIPYYALLMYGAWWLVEKMRRVNLK
jgi:hypothetical protein